MIRERLRPARSRALSTAIALAIVFLAGGGLAAGFRPIADSALRHLAAAARLPETLGTDWRLGAAREVIDALCAAESGTGVRLALATEWTVAAEDHRCASAGLPAPATFAIGREAVYLVARRSGDGFRLRSRDLYLALAAEVPRPDGRRVPNPFERWRELDPHLPDSPIRVRVPAPDSPLGELFAQAVLEAGCLSFAANRAIFDVHERVAACTALRADGAVVAGTVEAAAWLAEQPAHAVAVVAQPDIARMDATMAVLALDGVVPTYAAVTTGSYPAARMVQLVVVAVPNADALSLTAVRALVGESTIGPSGALAEVGLTPLPAAERVALRERLGALGGD